MDDLTHESIVEGAAQLAELGCTPVREERAAPPGRSVLIVGDSRTMRRQLATTMQRLGFENIAEAEPGVQGLERLAEHRPTIAIVDWDIPTMCGREFVERMRRDRAYDRMRVLVVSSESSARVVDEALKAGADDYATLPITDEIISDKLTLLGLAP